VGQGPERRDAGELLDQGRVGVFVRLGDRLGLDQEDAGDLQPSPAELADGERRVVDGSEGGAGDQENREPQMLREIGAGEAGGVGDEEAACGFDEEAIAGGRELARALKDRLD
jgi:hypothetical protein